MFKRLCNQAASATIGFIGAGNMGAPMAANLLKAGHQLLVCDASAAAVQRMVALGASAAGSPQEIAETPGACALACSCEPSLLRLCGASMALISCSTVWVDKGRYAGMSAASASGRRG